MHMTFNHGLELKSSVAGLFFSSVFKLKLALFGQEKTHKWQISTYQKVDYYH